MTSRAGKGRKAGQKVVYIIHRFIVFCCRCFLRQDDKQKEQQSAIMLILDVTAIPSGRIFGIISYFSYMGDSYYK